MGVFSDWQPRYAEHGIATFPLLVDGKTKKPATKGYERTGLKGSGQLSIKFPDASAFAFMAGQRSGITIVDIDAPNDEDLLRDVLRRYGDTPLISRTGSGGFHCYYGHGGEGRKIRIDPNTPVDVLGGGVAAAPPSRGAGGNEYAFIRGTLADLHRLPFIKSDAGKAEVQQAVARELVKAGSRNKMLMDYLRGQARYADDLPSLVDVAFSYADEHMDRSTGHPFTDTEVQAVAKSVWDWTQERIGAGQYFVGTGRHLVLGHDTIDKAMDLGPFAFTLFMHLQRRCGAVRSFHIANDMRKDMPGGEWPRRKMQDARKALCDAGIIREIHPASSFYGTAKFEWA